MPSPKKITLPVFRLIAAMLSTSVVIYLRGQRNKKKWLKRGTSQDFKDYRGYCKSLDFLFLGNKLERFLRYMELDVSVSYIRKEVKRIARDKKKARCFLRKFQYK